MYTLPTFFPPDILSFSPLAGVFGGNLAAEVIKVEGFGFVAGGYGDEEHLFHEYTWPLNI